IGRMFWPVNLAAFYPYRATIAPATVAAAGAALVLTTIAAILVVRRAPYVTVGWLWYVGTLVPVIGIVQVGGHAMADRFTAVPVIGRCIAIVWSLDALKRRVALPFAASASVLAAVLLALSVASRRQVMHWENGVALWTHAVEATPDSARAHANLGV